MLGCFIAVQGLAGAPAPALPSDHVAVERFLGGLEKPPVAYQARRRMDAASIKLNESAWMEALTEYHPNAGFSYSILAQGGSERIRKRVLNKVLEAERENSSGGEWRRGNLSRSNYIFEFDGRAGAGMLKMRLTPRRRDSRLVSGAAILTATSGDLVRVEGRLSKSPSFWVRWVNVSSTYSPVGGTLMPVAIESTADVRIAGMSTFSMTYDYHMVDGQAINASPKLLVER
ncbi:MAG: hypothetical protein EHM55_01460 [Acidobacteria bacterium]|nr:MAG: hypothetical protein EHM55_01460 [Acidobacteriota bacterium]